MGRLTTKEELAQATRFGPFCPVYLLADNKTIVKTGKTIRATEAHTMRFVREHTTMPVPEVYSVYEDEESGAVRIVMEYIQGTNLGHAWETLTEEEKESVVQQLRGYFDELRQIKGSFIGSVDGSACDDQFFSDDLWAYGPYKNEAEFNKGLVKAWTKDRDDPHTRLLVKTLLHVGQGHEIVMTHGDFAARNILVQGSKVVAILDWEFSGFYPEHWEFCKALWRTEWEAPWVKEGLLERVLDPYYPEVSLILNTSYKFW
ncbi:kinase-like domain-containing protein [Parachaetomium inaequale]|uniref:Kinase-like domain-containing protein n=1 Tax=Parachaetomium inaequale TaxID=2588326 RepID=A0AAN6PPR2_9PEZI|nr:kinase-like domain-containing protein [Parachaetomium inaequale]